LKRSIQPEQGEGTRHGVKQAKEAVLCPTSTWKKDSDWSSPLLYHLDMCKPYGCWIIQLFLLWIINDYTYENLLTESIEILTGKMASCKI